MNYNYDYESVAAGGILGVLAGVFIVVLLISLAVYIITVIGMWKVFSKGGKPGWGALIPIYNNYLMCDMVGVSPWWVLVVLFSAVIAKIPVIGGLVELAIIVYFSILLNVSLARSFGKSNGFAVGLILLPVVFYPILGFGKDEFIGKNPMDDFVFGRLNKNQNNDNVNPGTNTYQQQNVEQPVMNDTTNLNNNVDADNQSVVTPMTDVNTQDNMPTEVLENSSTANKSCPYCGAQVDVNSNFCPSCGKQIN